MSHLAHVLPIKGYLTEQGVFCPTEQSHMLNEAYIRASLMYVFGHRGGNFSEPVQEYIWKQLEKWNRVSPINGNYIHQSISARTNLISGALATSGTLPCSEKFNTRAQEAELANVNVVEAPGFNELVGFLNRELVAGNE